MPSELRKRPSARQLVQKSHQRVRISMPMMPTCSTGKTQVNSARKFFAQRGAGSRPLRRLNDVTYQNMKMVATHARQHHRHSELIRYRDSNWSQLTNPTPKRVPALKVSQYQRRKRPPARMLMPTQMT